MEKECEVTNFDLQKLMNTVTGIGIADLNKNENNETKGAISD
jgi:hypothetical protein